jgi:predicted glycosyltransferase
MLICEGLGKRLDNLSTLIVTGSPMAHGFRMPQGVDYVKMPSVVKLDNELYASRTLPIPFQQTLALREEIIFQTVSHYQPDFFFVDNVPLGMKGELRKTLEYIREELPATRVILNLRDIVDSARHVVPLWRQYGVYDVLEKFYDRIFIYGQPAIFDPLKEYGFPDRVRSKSRFCGYIPRSVNKQASERLRQRLQIRDGKFIVLTVGGGSDGAPIIDAYLKALPLVMKKTSLASVVLLGSEIGSREAQRFKARAGEPEVRLVGFCDDPLTYLDAADLVVSMAGYNTVSEIMALGKRAIVIPRTSPRQEQLIRARRLHELGLLHMIHPSNLTPELLADRILAMLDSTEPPSMPTLDFRGMDRLGDEMQLLVNDSVERQLTMEAV